MYYYKINGGISTVKDPIPDAEEISVEEYTKRKTVLIPKELTEEESEMRYWQSTPYDETVNSEIRKKYTVSQEFSILRQRDEKPEEYAEYYSYCEECKSYAKEMKARHEK